MNPSEHIFIHCGRRQIVFFVFIISGMDGRLNGCGLGLSGCAGTRAEMSDVPESVVPVHDVDAVLQMKVPLPVLEFAESVLQEASVVSGIEDLSFPFHEFCDVFSVSHPDGVAEQQYFHLRNPF